MTTAEKYVTAAYLVVLAVILLYVVLYAFKLARLEREVAELAELARRKTERAVEAALAYLGDVLRPGRAARFAVWGVRIGWLAQTALLGVQAARAEGFPWTTWAGSLNLFVWLVVGSYLVWGCRSPFRLLGLAVMPRSVAG